MLVKAVFPKRKECRWPERYVDDHLTGCPWFASAVTVRSVSAGNMLAVTELLAFKAEYIALRVFFPLLLLCLNKAAPQIKQ